MDTRDPVQWAIDLLAAGLLVGVWLGTYAIPRVRLGLERRLRPWWERAREGWRRMTNLVEMISRWAHPGLPIPSPVVVGPTVGDGLIVGPGEPITVGPSDDPGLMQRTMSAITVGPPAAMVVDPPKRAAWDDRGWALHQENGHAVYEGFYQVIHHRSGQRRRFIGRIESGPGEIVPFIADPPAEIKRHPKGPCFMLTHAPWFRIHWHRPATNVDDTILYIEKILDEALNGSR